MPKKSKFAFADVRKALAQRLAGSAEQREFLWAAGWQAWHKKFNLDSKGERTDGGVFPAGVPCGQWTTAPLGDGGCLWGGLSHFIGRDPDDPGRTMMLVCRNIGYLGDRNVRARSLKNGSIL